jgi:hypothetical protein
VIQEDRATLDTDHKREDGEAVLEALPHGVDGGGVALGGLSGESLAQDGGADVAGVERCEETLHELGDVDPNRSYSLCAQPTATPNSNSN